LNTEPDHLKTENERQKEERAEEWLSETLYLTEETEKLRGIWRFPGSDG
jgi:hypothetical protein